MVGADVGIWTVAGDAPVRAVRSKVSLEKDLEAWIAADSSLLADGLRIVGQQVRLEGGPLDLLAIDAQGRWLVIELKRERLYREAVAQALDYAACLAALSATELREKLLPSLASLGDEDELIEAIDLQLDGEEEREIAVALVGTGVDPGLERVVAYLGGFELPMSVVTFEIFSMPDGQQLLVREVIEERTEAPAGQTKERSVEDIRRQAIAYSVVAEFDRLIAAAEAAGLFVRPQKRSVTITPPTHKNRFLMAFRPMSDGRLQLSLGPAAFAEFYAELTAEDVASRIPEGLDDQLRSYEGGSLIEAVDAIEAFLGELPPIGAVGSTQDLYLEFWEAFLTRFHQRYPTWGGTKTPPAFSWVNFPAGRSGVSYGANFNRGQGFTGFRVELYLDMPDPADNEQLLEQLTAGLEHVTLPFEVTPEPLAGKRACRVAAYYPEPVIVNSRECWEPVTAWALDAVGQLREALDPILSGS